MNDCIVWDRYVNDKGYGRRHHNGKFWLVHRLEWTLANGDIPEGMCVLHKCDNPPCINLDHLFLGTNVDNIADKVAKGRQARNYKTHCKNGHEYTPENTFIRKQGWKECRICIRTNQNNNRRKKKA